MPDLERAEAPRFRTASPTQRHISRLLEYWQGRRGDNETETVWHSQNGNNYAEFSSGNGVQICRVLRRAGAKATRINAGPDCVLVVLPLSALHGLGLAGLAGRRQGGNGNTKALRAATQADRS